MLEDDDDFTRADVFITPPCDPNCSDEDSGDEDEGTCHNLTRRQLAAEAVATVTRGEEQIRIDGGDESHCVYINGDTDCNGFSIDQPFDSRWFCGRDFDS